MFSIQDLRFPYILFLCETFHLYNFLSLYLFLAPLPPTPPPPPLHRRSNKIFSLYQCTSLRSSVLKTKTFFFYFFSGSIFIVSFFSLFFFFLFFILFVHNIIYSCYIFSAFISMTALSWKTEPIDCTKYEFSKGTVIEYAA